MTSKPSDQTLFQKKVQCSYRAITLQRNRMWLFVPIKFELELCSLVTVFLHKAKQPANVSISNANWPLDGTLETTVCSSQKAGSLWEHKPPIENELPQHLVDYMDVSSMIASLFATGSTHAKLTIMFIHSRQKYKTHSQSALSHNNTWDVWRIS